MTEHIRMSGMYWGITAVDLLGCLGRMDHTEIVSFIQQCQDKTSGGIAPSIQHDPHMLSTLSAVQILVLLDSVSSIDVEGVVRYVSGLQNSDGSFNGDKWGEVDTRFSFCAVACLRLLVSGGELNRVDFDTLGWWLCERQLPSGGLNGRPEKLPDVCYSWWVLSSLTLLNRLHWINPDKMRTFILATQDPETGGFTDRPGDVPDLYHTLFGLAGLSLLGDTSLKRINPVFCMPQYVIDKLNISIQIVGDD
ncbi:hypothetical protein HAZT_HAZT009302 [Hyalella azteca]|uniref:Geranylgeranyl transferase type-2 subunit beta n=1 Tax=Hyalella azteca TaxID=294128 RepID=A0A6A0HAG0_HYAAZ|nr:hypothetical protein HAZT_HAZT009302 [Hyalella azteca]